MILPKDKPFAFVLWNDAHSPAATEVYDAESVQAVHGSLPIITGGWVLRNDDRGITVAGEYCGGTEYRGVTFVPKAMVVEIHLVPKPVRAPRKRKATAPAAHTDESTPLPALPPPSEIG